MPLAYSEKAYYTFAKGINTDASPIAFPENYSLDEQNFSLKLDGTRRRRRGLDIEVGGELISGTAIEDGEVFACFHWSNVANDPGNDLIVVQAGSTLLFLEDGISAPTSNVLDLTIDLLTYKTEGSTDAQVKTSKIDVAFGRGHLFVVGSYINPFYVRYDADAETITETLIDIKERDFEGVEDGIDNQTQPITATDSHTYNLRNRGWSIADILTFVASKLKQPSKNMIPWKGYRGATTANVAEQDWTKEFSPDKLVAELFQDASAPVGHFIRSPFVNEDIAAAGGGNTFAIETWSNIDTVFTITTDGAHGLAPAAEITIAGNRSYYVSTDFNWINGEPVNVIRQFTLNGSYTVTSTPTADTFTITKALPPNFSFQGWDDQYNQLGTVSVISAANPDGINALRRPTNVAFFAGRVWYAGTPYEKLANRVYFSQVIESDAQYAKCYQVADPTQEEFNVLVDSDGGVIVIPEMAQLLQMIPYSTSLLLYATNGIWQIGPGGNGYFTATSYSVRKISEMGAIGSLGVVMAENVPYYWGASGVYRILQDPNQGFLYVENISMGIIDTLYNSIDIEDKRNVQGVFDTVTKQIFWLYRIEAEQDSVLDTVLIFDTRLEAFTKWAFGVDGEYVPVSVVSIKDLIKNDTSGPIRVLGVSFFDDELVFGATEATDYLDFNSSEKEAFLVTGYDTAGNAAMMKYGMWVHCFMGKTETGYSESGTDLIPVNESSMTLQARWDWSDNTSAGKWGTPQQIYRHRRLYTPADVSDTFDDGQPVLVTKNKVRGRGRSLHLKYLSGSGKDSWLLGWQVGYGGMTSY